MNIIDCFLYNNEDLILELRLNLLDKHIDKFVIIEARHNHSGVIKENYNFNIDNFKKFKDKIIYLQLEDFPNGLKIQLKMMLKWSKNIMAITIKKLIKLWLFSHQNKL